LIAYEDQPALAARLRGVIIKVDNISIHNQGDLGKFMKSSYPGQEINIFTMQEDEIKEYKINLSSNPLNKSLGYLGIGFLSTGSSSEIISKFISFIQFKDPSVSYVPRYNKEVANFFYYLFWWIALISLLVGLFNMLPLGILDGGRFFYLIILSITKSKRIAEYLFKIISGVILFIFLFLTLIWFFRLF
jgi:membrane-associated protease RseP (regulator of RpoE activity)